MDQSVRDQIVEQLKEANNVLVTVSANPSVDQLAACIGLTLLLNKLDKHGAAVFSGEVPSTIEFLKPEETLEKTTDSLRDFIIALDKSKADKLRYKVEDKIVKIFITPYRTSLSQDDLEFSQGDFNVDVVVALGVREREDLDEAITAHGRILHDARIISINNQDQGTIGTINWVDLNASSLSEMLASVAQELSKEPLDSQMATAFMTGIVAETQRFSNQKTSPATMTIASRLLSAGADQQLIATKLEAAQPIPQFNKAAKNPANRSKNTAKNATNIPESNDGALRIEHEDEIPPEQPQQAPASDADPYDVFSKPVARPKPVPPPSDPEAQSRAHERIIQPPPQPRPLPPLPDMNTMSVPRPMPQPNQPLPYTPLPPQDLPTMIMEPPSRGGQLTANSEPEHANYDPAIDPLGAQNSAANPLLNRTPLAPQPPRQPAPMPMQMQQQPAALSPQPLPEPEFSLPPRPPQSEPQIKLHPQPQLPPEPQRTAPAPAPLPPPPPPAPAPRPPDPVIEAPFIPPDTPPESVEEAREAVNEAIEAAGAGSTDEPIIALGAQPLGPSLHQQAPLPDMSTVPQASAFNANTEPLASAPEAGGFNLPTPGGGTGDPFAPSLPPSVIAPSQPPGSVNPNDFSPPPMPPPLAPL